MSCISIQNLKYKHMLASLLCVGALINTQPAEGQRLDSSQDENDAKGIYQPLLIYEQGGDEIELYRSKKSILSDLKDEIRCLKNINHGKSMQRAGKRAEKVSEFLKGIGPDLLKASLRCPLAVEIIVPLYVSSVLASKGAEKALPLIGDKMKVHYTQKRKDIRENLKEMDFSYLNDQVNELDRKLESFHRKSTRKIFEKLIEEKKELIENL